MTTQRPGWTLLSSHGQVLVLISRDPSLTLAELAAQAGLSERRAHTVVADLAAAGYLTVGRDGRRNTYSVDGSQAFRHPALADLEVSALLGSLA